MSTGHRFSIGAVMFAKWEERHGRQVLAYQHLWGDERRALLQRVADRLPLPDDLVLVGQRSGGGYVEITHDEVAWETSSIRPSPKG
jgi:hypothetical protein